MLWSVLFGSTHLCQQLELDLTCAKQVRASERENMATVPERRGSELFFVKAAPMGDSATVSAVASRTAQ